MDVQAHTDDQALEHLCFDHVLENLYFDIYEIITR